MSQHLTHQNIKLIYLNFHLKKSDFLLDNY
jgi:hypothetical protein